MRIDISLGQLVIRVIRNSIFMSDKRVKLVQIIAESGLGGGPTHVLGILKHIDQKKFDSYLICPAGYLSKEAKQIKGVTVFNVSMSSKFDLFSIVEIKAILAKIRIQYNPFGPMIVHSHGARAGLLARIIMPKGIKNIYTEHRWDSDFKLKNPINNWLQKKLLARMNLKSDMVIAVSTSVKDFLVKEKLALENRVKIIPNGIDIGGTRSIKIKEKITHPIIGTIGNLKEVKGHKYLIEAMSHVVKDYPLASLEIIGEGEERTNLQKLIDRLNLSHNVSLLGYKENPAPFMKHWNVFALSSLAETFGIVLLEAMEMGLPIVATKVGGIPDIIENKKNGILVSPRNSKMLAQGIVDIIKHPVKASKLKKAALERVRDFEWDKVIKEIENLYLFGS